MSEHENWTPIRIEAPLPLAVASTLMQLIGAAWPEAVIETNRARGHALNMLVPNESAKSVDQEFIDEIRKGADESDDGSEFLGFDDGWVAFSPPEELCLHLGRIAHSIWLAHEDAVNHVEWEVRTSEDSTDPRYVLSISKSKERTPLAMRKAAEAEVERLKALLEKHGIDPNEAP